MNGKSKFCVRLISLLNENSSWVGKFFSLSKYEEKESKYENQKKKIKRKAD